MWRREVSPTPTPMSSTAIKVASSAEVECLPTRRLAGRNSPPDPERAVPCAMVMLALLLREFMVFNQAGHYGELTLLSDEQLQNELSRMFLGCLGVKPS